MGFELGLWYELVLIYWNNNYLIVHKIDIPNSIPEQKTISNLEWNDASENI